jgi:putative (di)nucleoside polyphosphate hydrolase
VLDPGGGEMAEFTEWAWLPLASLPGRVVRFKRPVYERVVTAFAVFAVPIG